MYGRQDKRLCRYSSWFPTKIELKLVLGDSLPKINSKLRITLASHQASLRIIPVVFAFVPKDEKL